MSKWANEQMSKWVNKQVSKWQQFGRLGYIICDCLWEWWWQIDSQSPIMAATKHYFVRINLVLDLDSWSTPFDIAKRLQTCNGICFLLLFFQFIADTNIPTRVVGVTRHHSAFCILNFWCNHWIISLLCRHCILLSSPRSLHRIARIK